MQQLVKDMKDRLMRSGGETSSSEYHSLQDDIYRVQKWDFLKLSPNSSLFLDYCYLRDGLSRIYNAEMSRAR